MMHLPLQIYGSRGSNGVNFYITTKIRKQKEKWLFANSGKVSLDSHKSLTDMDGCSTHWIGQVATYL
jgi:hypothetical protein